MPVLIRLHSNSMATRVGIARVVTRSGSLSVSSIALRFRFPGLVGGAEANVVAIAHRPLGGLRKTLQQFNVDVQRLLLERELSRYNTQ